jgi:hypothetical protein
VFSASQGRNGPGQKQSTFYSLDSPLETQWKQMVFGLTAAGSPELCLSGTLISLVFPLPSPTDVRNACSED